LPRIRTHYAGLGVSAIRLTAGERDVLNVKEKYKVYLSL